MQCKSCSTVHAIKFMQYTVHTVQVMQFRFKWHFNETRMLKGHCKNISNLKTVRGPDKQINIWAEASTHNLIARSKLPIICLF
jgi:hypothetical protein